MSTQQTVCAVSARMRMRQIATAASGISSTGKVKRKDRAVTMNAIKT